MKKLRQAIWNFAIKNHPEAMLLSRPLIILRAVLFPLDTIYWKINTKTGYQWLKDTWIIEGVEYSGKVMRDINNSNGKVYRITRVGNCVHFERLRKFEGKYEKQ